MVRCNVTKYTNTRLKQQTIMTKDKLVQELNNYKQSVFVLISNYFFSLVFKILIIYFYFANNLDLKHSYAIEMSLSVRHCICTCTLYIIYF